jgi:hypothetical protein
MIAALLAAAIAAAPAPAPFGSTTYRQSPRHPRVVLAPRPGVEAALLIRFDAGSADDGAWPGLTRAVQNAMVMGQRGRSYAQVIDALYAAGADVSIDTGVRSASFLLVAHRDDFPALARMLVGLVLAPDIDPRRLEDVRDRTYLDAREGSGRDLVAMLADKVVEDGDYGNPPHGTQAGIESIGLDEIRAHLAGPLSPANATVVAAGAFDPRALRAALAGVSGPPRRPRPDPQVLSPFSLQIPSEREVYLVGYRVGLDDPARGAAARVAAALLDERISRFFRSRGVGYSQLVEPLRLGWLDLFLVALPAHDPSNEPLGGYLEERVREVRDGKPDDGELARARDVALASLERTDRTPAALALELSGPAGPGRYGPELAAQVRELAPDALRAGIAALFREDRAIRILYSPRAERRGPIPESFSRPSPDE